LIFDVFMAYAAFIHDDSPFYSDFCVPASGFAL
jgi:hypothetical protein